VPDIDLHSFHRRATVFAVEYIDGECEWDAALRTCAVQVGKDVGAQVPGGAVVHKVWSFFAFEGFAAGCGGGDGDANRTGSARRIGGAAAVRRSQCVGAGGAEAGGERRRSRG
jgi:hypothetical protein